jgi:hypothetical protein
VYVISELVDPESRQGVWKRTDALDAVEAIGLCARLEEHAIYSRIVAVCERFGRLPIATNWKEYAADWQQRPARRKFRRETMAARSLT